MSSFEKQTDSILDASSTSSKRKNFYLIHHQSSLVPIKNFINQTLNSNIERIQMDEQDSMLEIVDGAINIVPKEKIMYMESDEEDQISDQHGEGKIV